MHLLLKMEVLRGRDFVALPGFFIESYETGTNEASRSKTLQTKITVSETNEISCKIVSSNYDNCKIWDLYLYVYSN